MKLLRVAALLLCSVLAFAGDLVDREPAVPLMFEARAALGKRDFPTAIAKMQEALKLAPDDAPMLFALAQIYARAGEKQKAMETLDRVAAMGLGFHPDIDPSFKALAQEPGWPALLKKFDDHLPQVAKSTVAFTIAEPDLYPEGIACDPRAKAFYVGSTVKRKILRVGAGGTAADFVASKQDGIQLVLGLKLDREGKSLWAVASAATDFGHADNVSGIYRYDLKTGKLLEKHLMPTTEPHFLNDLDITANGDVYATDVLAGTVYRFVPGSDNAPEAVVEPGKLRGANGIAFSPDGNFLYVAASGRGLSLIDMKAKRLSVVLLPHGVATVGIDGLYWHRNSLVGIQNVLGRARVMRWQLAAPTGIGHSEILDQMRPELEEPTTGTFCGDDFHYLANTQLNHADDKGQPEAGYKTKPVIVLKIRLR
ncbi:MAG TPA: tetratricopeptide repeat protein [Terriglobales bacterium]|nr:tetratricopeptide repeat protein [Terriglobales bacterium]